jgi:hypothetical protein
MSTKSGDLECIQVTGALVAAMGAGAIRVVGAVAKEANLIIMEVVWAIVKEQVWVGRGDLLEHWQHPIDGDGGSVDVVVVLSAGGAVRQEE